MAREDEPFTGGLIVRQWTDEERAYYLGLPRPEVAAKTRRKAKSERRDAEMTVASEIKSQAVQMLADGKTAKEVSAACHVSEATVYVWRQREGIKRETEVRGMSDLQARTAAMTAEGIAPDEIRKRLIVSKKTFADITARLGVEWIGERWEPLVAKTEVSTQEAAEHAEVPADASTPLNDELDKPAPMPDSHSVRSEPGMDGEVMDLIAAGVRPFDIALRLWRELSDVYSVATAHQFGWDGRAWRPIAKDIAHDAASSARDETPQSAETPAEPVTKSTMREIDAYALGRREERETPTERSATVAAEETAEVPAGSRIVHIGVAMTRQEALAHYDSAARIYALMSSGVVDVDDLAVHTWIEDVLETAQQVARAVLLA